MQLERSRVDEAAPVVTGRVDAASADLVFTGWRASKALQESFNPFVELDQARALRDRAMHRFLVKAGQLIGAPSLARAASAQMEIIAGLIRRGWSLGSIENYLRVRIDKALWAELITSHR